MNIRGKAAVIVAHPGHELMVYHWMERHRPLYFCLTDGSGGDGRSRLDSTGRLLRNLGCATGSLFGRFTDKEMYRLLLDGRVDAFVELRDELAASVEQQAIHLFVGEAA